MLSPEIVVAGHVCLDIIPTIQSNTSKSPNEWFSPGRLLQIGKAITATGGTVANTGVALYRLGKKPLLVGKVGKDIFGTTVLKSLSDIDENLTKHMIVSETEATSYTIVLSPPGVDRAFLHYPGTNDTFGVRDVPFDQLTNTRLFHFGYPPLMKKIFEDDGLELRALFHKAKKQGMTTSLDMAMPDPHGLSGQVDWRTVLKNTLPYVDIFLPSIEEILYMLDRDTYFQLSAKAKGSNLITHLSPTLMTKLSDQLLDMGCKIVVLKMGNQGLYMRTSSKNALRSMGKATPTTLSKWHTRELWTPCFLTNVVGTTGAGDCTIAGFLTGFLYHFTPETTLTSAVAVGACNVEAADATSGVNSWGHIQKRIKQGWERRPLSIRLPEWRFNREHNLWVGPRDRH